MPIQLQYPFEDKISPYVDQLEAMTSDWTYHYYISTPEHVKPMFANALTGHITARFFPLASYERLIPMTRNSLWGMIFDDSFENCNFQEFNHLRCRVYEIMMGADPLPHEHELFPELARECMELRQFMPEDWMQRYANSMAGWVESMQEEMLFKSCGRSPTLQEYLRLREIAVDVYPLVDLIEVATELPLPNHVRYHPVIRRVASLTCRMIAWANDFFSVDKDINTRDCMNMILVLKDQFRLSREEACEELVRIHNEDLAEYLQLCDRLPDFGTENKAVEQFIYQNGLMIQGHKSWYEKDTLRYRKGGHPEYGTFKGGLPGVTGSGT